MEQEFEEVIYDSANRGGYAIEELKNVFRYRDLLIQLVRRDLVSRYKRSVLGVAWTMLNPLGMMLVLTIVFSQVFNRSDNYPVYILTGLTVWNFFGQVSSASMGTMVWGSSLFEYIYLPRTVFVLSSIGTGVVNFVLSLVPLALIMLLVGAPFFSTLLALPIAFFLLITFTTGFSLVLCTFVVYFQDIREIYPILLMAWMYVTPIIMPEEVLSQIADGLLLKINPFYYIIDSFHKLVLEGVFPSLGNLLVAAGVSLAVLIFGWILFTNNADKLAYYA